MQGNTEIEELLNNMRKALKQYSVKELNEAISLALGEKDIGIKKEVNYVMKIVSQHYKVSEKVLKNSISRGKIADAKHIAYCLLHYDLGLSVGYISQRIFCTWRNSVYLGVRRIKTINTAIKSDKEFSEKYRLMQSKLLIFITDKK